MTTQQWSSRFALGSTVNAFGLEQDSPEPVASSSPSCAAPRSTARRSGSSKSDARYERLRAVILHGAHGRPDSNWFPWLAERIEAAGHEAVLPRFPTPAGQSPEAWLDAYGRQVDDAMPHSRTLLVAHSLGVAFALRLAARASTTDSYRGVFLAAGFWGALGLSDYDPINAPFFAGLDWEAARAGCGPTIACYAGSDDPYVPLRFSRAIAERLRTPLRVIPGGKHLNAENGMTTFAELAADLDTLITPAPIADAIVP